MANDSQQIQRFLRDLLTCGSQSLGAVWLPVSAPAFSRPVQHLAWHGARPPGRCRASGKLKAASEDWFLESLVQLCRAQSTAQRALPAPLRADSSLCPPGQSRARLSQTLEELS